VASLPQALEALIGELGKLPGVGRRSAERLAFALLEDNSNRASVLADVLQRVVQEVGECPECGFFADRDKCPFCSDPGRDDRMLCIVEDASDVAAFEKAGGFRGRYHVLGGVLSPLKGVGPDDLRMAGLFSRLAKAADDGRPVEEVVLALPPSVEGDATALYIGAELRGGPTRLTRIGRGVSMGSSLEMTDAATLRLALEGRRALED
jgi:recombination protein RecR